MNKNIMDIETVTLDVEKNELLLIDQTKLPYEVEVISIHTKEEIWHAINILQVRGAPAIGVAAAIGIYVVSSRFESRSIIEFKQEFEDVKDYLATSRPTAVNLFWALDKMHKIVKNNADKSVGELKILLKKEAMKIHDDDIEVCRKIGENGLSLVKPGDGLLTHCNAGKLATVKYGTATAPMYIGYEKGYDFKIFADETRPLLQGARLTSYELKESGLDVTLICDNMSASVMRNGWIQAVFVGCDRVAANGDVANKIGTNVVATVAKRYNIPVYVCSPTSTIDVMCKTGDEINIEERKPEEITELWYKERMAPKGVKIYNPAFDITDNDLIAGIVTEYGVLEPPYDEAIKNLFDKIDN